MFTRLSLNSAIKRIHYLIKTILRHCPDLFDGSQITIDINEENKKSFLESLGHLEGAKPAEIRVIQGVDLFVDFWHHPTFLNCNRVDLDFWSHFEDATMMTAFENIFDWLHHKPIGMDCDGSAANQDRCMIVSFIIDPNLNHIDWLLNRCSNDIQEAQEPIDRRQYVLSFACFDMDWPGFHQFRRIENNSTGEVLTLERKMRANGQATHRYRLRRCLAKEEANVAMFYAEMFQQDYVIDLFNIGDKTTKVVIK